MEHASDDTRLLPNDAVIGALRKLLDKKFPQRKYTYSICNASEKGDNYLGVVYRITVQFVGSEEEHFRLILKVPPHNFIRREQFFARPCFLRESLAYEEFLPLVENFQSSKGIQDKQLKFHEYAKCYCCITVDMEEAIFLEDLCVQKFELFNRFDQLTREYVALVMRVYAKLHAVSFAIKDQQPEELQKFQHMSDIFQQRRDDTQLHSYFEELKKSAVSALDAERDRSYINTLEHYFAKNSFFDLFLDLIDGTQCEPYAVVCHGDCWNNNILFKIENENVVEARLIDWQIMRYASPITDIMYFFFTCTTREFRKQHFGEMLDVYYRELSDHIKRLGSQPSLLFSSEDFSEEVKSKGAVGLLFAMMILPIATMKGEDVPNLEELSERIHAGGSTDLVDSGFLSEGNANEYSTRIRDTIVDCIDFGYI